MEKISYKLEIFEGPLDLLLNLISKHKLNIYDIQINELVKQYMAYIDEMKRQDMDIESEFLEMAARLVYIKSVSLLPKKEEAKELSAELSGQLIDYKECKAAAELLSNKINFDTFSRLPSDLNFDMTYEIKHNPQEIYSAYLNVLGKVKKKIPVNTSPKEVFSKIVSKKIVSVASRAIYILRNMWKNKEVIYQNLFKKNSERSELVATFLAILELVKNNRIYIDDEEQNIKLKLLKGGGKNRG